MNILNGKTSKKFWKPTLARTGCKLPPIPTFKAVIEELAETLYI